MFKGQGRSKVRRVVKRFLQCGPLIFPTLDYERDTQIPRTFFYQLTAAAADDADFHTAALQQLDAVSIKRRESFEFIATVAEVESAVSEDAIHIEDKSFDALCAFLQLGVHVLPAEFR